jgi:hypothetical protein
VHSRIISAGKRVEFVTDRMSCMIYEDYEELELAFDKFPKYHMKILLGDFVAKVGKEDIFKLTTGNESVHEISNDNRVRAMLGGSLSPQHGASSGCGWRNSLHLAANILNKQQRTNDKAWSSTLWVGCGANNPSP